MNDLRTESNIEKNGVELGDLSNSLGFLLRLAQVQIFEDFFKALAKYNLKPGEFSVLWVVSLNPGQRQGAIARSLHIKPAHMTKVVHRLEKSGFLSRTIPDNDRRSVKLALTAEGKGFVIEHKSDFFDYYQRDQTRLSETEHKTLLTLLQKLVNVSQAAQ